MKKQSNKVTGTDSRDRGEGEGAIAIRATEDGGIRELAGDDRDATAEGRNPMAEIREPGVEGRNPMAEIREPGAEGRNPMAEIREPGVEGRNPMAEVRDSGAESRNPTAEVRDATAEPRNPMAEIRDPGAEGRSPKSEVREPGAESRNPTAEIREPTAEGRNPTAEIREPTAEGRNPTAEAREPGAEVGKPAIGSGGPIVEDVRAIASLAAPLAATQLAQVAVSSLSVAILASLGPLELAGGGLAMMLFNLARTVGVGLVTGTANLVADADARDATRPGIRSLALAGLAIAAIAGTLFACVLLGIGPVLARFGQSAEVIAVAERYLKGAVLGLLPCLGFNVLRNVSVGLRRPGPVLVITIVSIGVHALVATVLSRGLFGAPALGALGIAISQTVTHVVTLVGIGWHVRRNAELASGRNVATVRVDIKRTLALGLPTAAAYGSEAGFFAVVTLLVGSFGSTVLAAHNIVNQVVYIVFMLAVGVSHGTSVQVSRARGAGDTVRVLRLGRVGFAIGAAVVCLVGLVEIVAPKLLLVPFASGATARVPEVMELAQSMLAVAVCFQLFDSMQNVAGALLRALHRPRVTLVVTLVGYWCVGLPIAWLLGRTMGPLGIWWGLAAGLAATALLLVVVFERLASARPRAPGLGLVSAASEST